MQAAQDRDRGILFAKRAGRSGEFVLFYNDRRAMLLFFNNGMDSIEAWEGPCLVAGFPHRPAWPEEPEEYRCGCGDCYFASGRHSIPRGEGFLLFQECLRIGELATRLPEQKKDYTQPPLPGMQEFIIPDEEWRQVEWCKVESGNYL
jgi:hypothetical protein